MQAIDDVGALNNLTAAAPDAYPEAINETQIGNTVYDNQTNAALQNRIWLHDDGTIGATWTLGFASTAFADRGTGYNYFNGTSWGTMPTARIENIRTGWPSYAACGAGGEIAVAHQSATTPLYISKRTTKGTGAWSYTTFAAPAGAAGLLWPRLVSSGPTHSIVHMIGVTSPVANGGVIYNGMDGALVYSRSVDGGTTWNINNVQLPGTDINYYNWITADSYVMADPKANTLAFLVGDCWYDLFVMKSTDGGDNWTKIMVWPHPYPKFDWNTTITDTLYAVDKGIGIALDNNGKAHVVFGITRVQHAAAGTSYSYWPYTDGIGYWNENMPAFANTVDALNPDALYASGNLIGWSPDVNGNGTLDLVGLFTYRELGMSTMPNVVVDGSKIILAYATPTEGYDNGTYNYKHIWARGSDNLGQTWGPFYDLSAAAHGTEESIYPVFAGYTNNNNLHLMYNKDLSPGTAVDGNHAYQDNQTMYLLIPEADIVVSTGFDLDLKVFLEGPFNPGTGLMEPWLNNSGNLPLSQPYHTYPWYYMGTESVAAIPGADVIDWVLFELRDAASAAQATSATMVAQQAAFLMKDGTVRGMDGTSLLNFNVTVTNQLYAVVWHRNHLGVMSTTGLPLNGTTYTYDFSSASSQAYGGVNGHKELAAGIWGMVSGDGNADKQINNSDKVDVWKVQSGSSGYKAGDFNMDGQVSNPDKIEKWKPNSGRSCQVPN